MAVDLQICENAGMIQTYMRMTSTSWSSFVTPIKHRLQELGCWIVSDIVLRKSRIELSFKIPFLEIFIFRQDLGGANLFETTLASKPVPYLSHSNFVLATVCFDITPCQIRYRRLIAISIFLEYQNNLLRKWIPTTVAAPKVHAKLKRHVQPIVFSYLLGLTSTKVMDRISG